MPIGHSPTFDRVYPDPGNPLTPARSRTGVNGHGTMRGLRSDFEPGTRVVPIHRPWPGMGLLSKVFPFLNGDDANGQFVIKPRLSTALNEFSPIAHSSSVERASSFGAGDIMFQDTGHPVREVEGAGPLDPPQAGRGFDRAQFNPAAWPVVPANRPVVKMPAVGNRNRRGGTGYVVPNPLAYLRFPLYTPGNMSS